MASKLRLLGEVLSTSLAGFFPAAVVAVVRDKCSTMVTAPNRGAPPGCAFRSRTCANGFRNSDVQCVNYVKRGHCGARSPLRAHEQRFDSRLLDRKGDRLSTAHRWPSLPGQHCGFPTGDTHRLTARHADEAELLVGQALVPHRLRVAPGADLDMELLATRVGHVAVGRLSYGQPVRVSMDDTPHFVLNLTLRGQANSRSGTGPVVLTGPEEGVVFAADQPLEIHGSADCQQLSIVAQKGTVEGQLERLLGRGLAEPLQFQARLSPDLLRVARPAFQLLLEELHAPTGLVPRATIARHVEGLMIDAMLLAQPHNYTSSLTRESAAGSTSAIARAAELMRERPHEPWTVVALAREVHLSVRALQYGFRRDHGTTPMTYLKSLRLSSARAALRRASPAVTTVREVALACGFLHMSRFAAAYRAEYGETPSTTLARDRHGS